MLDIETLGTAPGCAIAAIGAVVFDPVRGLGDEFYRRVNIKSCVDVGLNLDVDTIIWWMQQSDAARKETFAPATTSISQSLMDFMNWRDHALLSDGSETLEVWGNGADFDNPILEAAFDACRLPAPWGRRDGRCYRTLKNLFPSIAANHHPKAVAHNALHDARLQAEHAVRILQHITKAQP